MAHVTQFIIKSAGDEVTTESNFRRAEESIAGAWDLRSERGRPRGYLKCPGCSCAGEGRAGSRSGERGRVRESR